MAPILISHYGAASHRRHIHQTAPPPSNYLILITNWSSLQSSMSTVALTVHYHSHNHRRPLNIYQQTPSYPLQPSH